ncbi:MAG: hypothetical protein K0R72_647 [Clostridia bacterium]|jgi:hypothetical protein|nr:hypothetical protein [Clostridia bacterium]
MNNKLIIKVLAIITFLFNLKSNIYGISDNFKFIIDTIGVPRYNVYYEEINEEIYNTYNVFAYSNPQGLLWHNQQRFKNENNFGRWTRYNGKYNGFGERGEYYLLGTSYSGTVVSNVHFPADFLPETTPDRWEYVVTNGAYESWHDKGKYKYEEQLEYMRTTDLLFDKINYNAGTINSYDLVSYNISANKVGLNKAVLNTSSTWKTNGVVTARRINNAARIRNAIFATAPMEADAKVLSKLNVEDNFILEATEDKIIIPIKISAEAIDLSDNANEKYIKEIVSVLYINNQEIARVSGSKTVKVDKSLLFTVSREDYKIPNTYPIDVKVKSYLYTEFSVDGLMQHNIQKIVNVKILEKEVIPINNMKIAALEKYNNILVIRPLVQTLNTQKENSEGIIEAGRHLIVGLEKNLNELDYECYINDEKVNYEKIYENGNNVALKININEKFNSTIKSWNYLRDEIKNYFEVDFSKIGERISDPNILKIVCNKKYFKIIKFDSIEKYSNNINYIFKNNVLNINEIEKNIEIGDWIINEK